jgi:DNA polymerase
MKTVYLDTETYSEIPITRGTHAYAEGVKIIMWQYAIEDGPVIVEEELSPELESILHAPDVELVIHNSHFDRTVIRHATGIDIPVSRIFDTMVCAMAHSFPGSLDTLCEILGVAKDKAKDKQGKKLISLFCKPSKATKTTPSRMNTKADYPEQWNDFLEYGRLDVEAMREIKKLLPTWNYRGEERELWELDQKINDRGVFVDLDLAHAALRAAGRAKTDYEIETIELTQGEVTSINRRDRLLEFIASTYDVVLPDLKSSTVAKLISDANLAPEILNLLAIRIDASKTSPSKYKRVSEGISSDGRLRGLLQFCGASRTGRWAGRLFQPQNLPRPTILSEALEEHIKELKNNAEGL